MEQPTKKWYLIIGGTSGIGLQTAKDLCAEGASVMIVGSNPRKMDDAIGILPEGNIGICYDLSDPYAYTNSVSSICNTLKGKQIHLYGIVYCAGIAPLMRIEENESETVQRVYTLNVFSFLEVIRHVVQDDLLQDNASIVTVSSVTAHRGSNRQSVYGGSKAALEGTVRCMAKELIPQSIRVNAVVCGVVETGMLQMLRCNSRNLDEKLMQSYPLGIISADEVSKMIRYLLSDDSKHITGASMQLDSGYLL